MPGSSPDSAEMLIEAGQALAAVALRARGFRLERRRGVTAWAAGVGSPLVLLHGALSRASTTWFRVAGALARERRVLMPDLPGFGMSRAALPEDASVRGMARVLAEALPEFSDGRHFAVAGESLGGWVAARLAIETPDALSSLTLVDAAGFFPDEEAGRALVDIITPETPEELARLLGLVVRRPLPLPALFARDMLSTYRRDYPALRHVILTGEKDQLKASELVSLRMPVTVIWGERDGLIPLDIGRALGEAIPGARLETLPGCAHVPPVQSPNLFLDAMWKALNRGQNDGEFSC